MFIKLNLTVKCDQIIYLLDIKIVNVYYLKLYIKFNYPKIILIWNEMISVFFPAVGDR